MSHAATAKAATQAATVLNPRCPQLPMAALRICGALTERLRFRAYLTPLANL
jgi:hypothetical protein